MSSLPCWWVFVFAPVCTGICCYFWWKRRTRVYGFREGGSWSPFFYYFVSPNPLIPTRPSLLQGTQFFLLISVALLGFSSLFQPGFFRTSSFSTSCCLSCWVCRVSCCHFVAVVSSKLCPYSLVTTKQKNNVQSFSLLKFLWKN